MFLIAIVYQTVGCKVIAAFVALSELSSTGKPTSYGFL